MRKLLAPVLLFALLVAVHRTGQAQAASTPEEKQHWVAVLHHLETDPTNQQSIDDGGDVVKRLIEVPDFHLSICDAMLELPKKYVHIQPITQLFMLGLAGYQVETGKSDSAGGNLYAYHSVLKGYAAILAKEPKPPINNWTN